MQILQHDEATGCAGDGAKEPHYGLGQGDHGVVRGDVAGDAPFRDETPERGPEWRELRRAERGIGSDCRAQRFSEGAVRNRRGRRNCASPENPKPAAFAVLGRGLGEPRLADPRLADQKDDATAAVRSLVYVLEENAEFRVAPNNAGRERRSQMRRWTHIVHVPIVAFD
jgi:hypothetical protein